MRIVRAALAVAVLSAAAFVPSQPSAASAPGSIEITDPLLLSKLAEASANRTEGVAAVTVEVLTVDDAASATQWQRSVAPSPVPSPAPWFRLGCRSPR